jgi:tetratricopeptide (TPR) repeat protein
LLIGLDKLKGSGKMGLFDFFKKKKLPTEVEKVFDKIHTELMARRMVDQAISHRNLGQYDQAICLLNDVLKKYPVYTPAKSVLGVTLMVKGDIEGAERHFKNMSIEYADGKEYPLAEIYANLGSLYHNHRKDIKTSLEYYQLALNSPKPDHISDEKYKIMMSGVYRDLCVIYFHKIRDLALAKQYAIKRLEVVKDCPAAKKIYDFCLLIEEKIKNNGK